MNKEKFILEQQTSERIKENVKNSSAWLRLLFMVLFTVLYSAAEVVIAVVVVYQFLTLLLTGEKNAKVLVFGGQLAAYVYQVFQFLTFNTEDKPFPMSSWPSSTPLVAGESKDTAQPVPNTPTKVEQHEDLSDHDATTTSIEQKQEPKA